MKIGPTFSQSIALLNHTLHSVATSQTVKKTMLGAVAAGPLAVHILSSLNLCAESRAKKAHHPVVLLLSSGAGLLSGLPYVGSISLTFNVMIVITKILLPHASNNKKSPTPSPNPESQPEDPQNLPADGSQPSDAPSIAATSSAPATTSSTPAATAKGAAAAQASPASPTRSSSPGPAKSDSSPSSETDDPFKFFNTSVKEVNCSSAIGSLVKTQVQKIGPIVIAFLHTMPPVVDKEKSAETTVLAFQQQAETNAKVVTHVAVNTIKITSACGHLIEDLSARILLIKNLSFTYFPHLLTLCTGIRRETQAEIAEGVKECVIAGFETTKAVVQTSVLLFKQVAVTPTKTIIEELPSTPQESSDTVVATPEPQWKLWRGKLVTQTSSFIQYFQDTASNVKKYALSYFDHITIA